MTIVGQAQYFRKAIPRSDFLMVTLGGNCSQLAPDQEPEGVNHKGAALSQ
jgi:hypothetical protein